MLTQAPYPVLDTRAVNLPPIDRTMADLNLPKPPAGSGGMRANVDTLLEEKKDAIAGLKATVKDCLPTTGLENTSNFYDDIFLLRYVLSYYCTGTVGALKQQGQSSW